LKKGCLKLIILIPITIGILIYIFDKYGKDFWNDRKTEAMELVHESIDKKFKEFVPNKYADSLKSEVIAYFSRLKDRKIKDVSDKVSEFYEDMGHIVKDSIISELDFNKLKKMMDGNEIK